MADVLRVIEGPQINVVELPVIGPQGPPGLNPWVVVTSARTAAHGDRLQCNTSGGAFTVTLPPTPAEGAEVWIYKAGAADLTLGRNGATFNGAAEDLVVDVDDVTLILNFRNGSWRY